MARKMNNIIEREMNSPTDIYSLLCDTKHEFKIPLYQRNFSWTKDEMYQLIRDVLDAMEDESKSDYYIGTLVICKRKGTENEFDIIDGQQRFIVILLIYLAFQNEYKISREEICKINLSFEARKASKDVLEKLFNNNINEIEDKYKNELFDGYNSIVDILENNLNDKKKEFYDYFLKNIKLFIDEMPVETDVNLYFERFNSRGEQLEAHEIIKAELIGQLGLSEEDEQDRQKFAKIWDACSQFETPCINFFKKKIKPKDKDEERELIFNCKWQECEPGNNKYIYEFNIEDVFRKISSCDENTSTISKALNMQKHPKEKISEIDEFNKYKCIVNFSTFLYYVLYITEDKKIEDIKLDDKKLKKEFNPKSRNKEWILKFGENLLKCKFIFDNLIIRSSLDTGEWFLYKAYRADTNNARGERLYVQTNFNTPSFKHSNDKILTLQSLFAVTFTAYRETKWLYETLKFLFDRATKLNDYNFGGEFYEFLENLTKKYARDKGLCDELGNVKEASLRYNNKPKVSVFAFNLMDYVILKNKADIKKLYPKVKFDEFRFTSRHSIEHWHPRNPNKDKKKGIMDDHLLHSFGNLCLIVASQNSAFGNSYPESKVSEWKSRFGEQSLKLQIMAEKTKELTTAQKEWNSMSESDIKGLEDYMLDFLSKYLRDKLRINSQTSE